MRKQQWVGIICHTENETDQVMGYVGNIGTNDTIEYVNDKVRYGPKDVDALRCVEPEGT